MAEEEEEEEEKEEIWQLGQPAALALYCTAMLEVSAMGCASLAVGMAALLLPHRCESVWTRRDWKHACLRFAHGLTRYLAHYQLWSLFSPTVPPPSFPSGRASSSCTA